MIKSSKPKALRQVSIRLGSGLPLLMLACGLLQLGPLTPTEETHSLTGSPPPTFTVVPAHTATETVVPPATITPLPVETESPPKILYQESFDDDTTCFKVRSLDPWIDLGIENGTYHIRVEGENGFNTLCIGGYDDFVLEYDLTLTEGGGHSVVGLMFRQYVGSSYNIYLTGINEFCWDYYDAATDVFRGLAGCWDQLPHWLDINTKLDIRIIAAQERMAVFINDDFIAAAYDYGLDYGSFGFFVANTGPGVTDILLDNIVIREIRQADIDVFRSSQTGY